MPRADVSVLAVVCAGISIDSTAPAEAVFASEIKKLQTMQFKPAEYVTLEPFERDHAVVVGTYRPQQAE